MAGGDDSDVISASWSNPEAFAELFDRHFPAVHQFCVRRVGAEVSEELASEAFTRAFAARRTYDLDRRDARPWLIGIALNTIRERVRRDRRGRIATLRLTSLAVAPPSDPGTAVPASADAMNELALVADALQVAPIDEVDTLLLHIWEGLSYEDCAAALGVPVGTVRSRIHRLRGRLQVALDSRGRALPTGPPAEARRRYE